VIRRTVRGLTVIALLLVAAGCSDGSSTNGTTPSAGGSPTSQSGTATTPTDAATGSPAADAANTAAPAPSGCLSDPMEHVYNPDRLVVLSKCVLVAGTVEVIRSEADGDYHVLIHLDAGQTCGGQDCLNAANVSQQHGDLVVEPVCEHTITQTDAESACAGYHNSLAVPPIGSHTTVLGPWVLDRDHGWNEIHPAEMFGDSPMSANAAPAAAPPPPAPATTFAVSITSSRYGYVAASTSPGAVCTAQAKLPSGRISTAAGLQVQDTAGSGGAVSWTYGTSSTTTPGTGTHTVSCTLNGATRSASASFTVG